MRQSVHGAAAHRQRWAAARSLVSWHGAEKKETRHDDPTPRVPVGIAATPAAVLRPTHADRGAGAHWWGGGRPLRRAGLASGSQAPAAAWGVSWARPRWLPCIRRGHGRGVVGWCRGLRHACPASAALWKDVLLAPVAVGGAARCRAVVPCARPPVPGAVSATLSHRLSGLAASGGQAGACGGGWRRSVTGQPGHPRQFPAPQQGRAGDGE